MQKRTEKLAISRHDWRRRARAAGPRTEPAVPGRAAGTFVHAKAVGSFVPRLTQKAFERYGFSTATLLTDWTLIVGADIAGTTLPERLKWPRRAGEAGEAEDEPAGRSGATLVLRVDPARALDIEYQGRQIVERINGYFGYRAVAALRLVQGPVEREPAQAASPRLPAAPAEEPAAADADPLARALARLAAAVRLGQLPGPRAA